MIRIYPKNENGKNDLIEKIIKDGLVVTDKNEWGYMISADSVARVNKMGYKLWGCRGGIAYER